MKMENAVEIEAPAERIYALAHATEKWAEYLPHYRFVRVLHEDANERLVEMAARRGWFPVRWQAIQRNDARTPRIFFRHVAGWTKGMDVEWQFEPHGERTTVRIVHNLQFQFPIAARFIERYIVSRFFIHGIASRTLSCFKRLAEERR